MVAGLLAAFQAAAAIAATPWSLAECIDYAVAHNLDLRQKQVATALADVDVDAKKGALEPSLSFATNQNGSWRPWSQQYVNLTDGSLSSTTSTVNYNGSYGLQAQWSVWDGGVGRKELQRSRVVREQSAADELAADLSLREEVATRYIQILYQRDAVEVNRKVMESTAVQLRQAREMYDVGKMSQADLSQVCAQLSQEEYNVVNASTALATSLQQLRQLLELPAGSDFDVAAPTTDADPAAAPLPSVDDVYAAAAASRPELQYSRLGIEAADMAIDIARRGRWPSVALSAGINTSASSGLDTGWARQMKTNLSNQLGLTVSIPILDRRQTSTAVARARLEREDADIALRQKERQLYNAIETLWLNADNASRQYQSATAAAASMRDSYSLVSEQFAVGLKDIVALTTAKTDLLQAEQQLLQAKYTALLNRCLLNFYSGSPLSL